MCKALLSSTLKVVSFEPLTRIKRNNKETISPDLSLNLSLKQEVLSETSILKTIWNLLD